MFRQSARRHGAGCSWIAGRAARHGPGWVGRSGRSWRLSRAGGSSRASGGCAGLCCAGENQRSIAGTGKDHGGDEFHFGLLIPPRPTRGRDRCRSEVAQGKSFKSRLERSGCTRSTEPCRRVGLTLLPFNSCMTPPDTPPVVRSRRSGADR